jgi:hypothetical protein
MASTFSNNLKIELITTGEQSGTWGVTTDNNFSNVFEQAIVGTGSVDFTTDADKTITITDSVTVQPGRALYLNITTSAIGGLTATRTLTVPTIYKNYVVANNTTQSIIVKTSAGTGITITAGTTVPLYVDGTNVVYAYNPMWDPAGSAVAFAIALGG